MAGGIAGRHQYTEGEAAPRPDPEPSRERHREISPHALALHHDDLGGERVVAHGVRYHLGERTQQLLGAIASVEEEAGFGGQRRSWTSPPMEVSPLRGTSSAGV